MPLKVAWGGGLTNYSSHDKHCTHRIMLTRLTHPRTLYSTKPYGEIVSPRLYVGPLPSKTQRCSIFEAEGGCQSSHSRIFSLSQNQLSPKVELKPPRVGRTYQGIIYSSKRGKLGVRLHSFTFSIHLPRSLNLCFRERYHLPRLLPPRWVNVRP